MSWHDIKTYFRNNKIGKLAYISYFEERINAFKGHGRSPLHFFHDQASTFQKFISSQCSEVRLFYRVIELPSKVYILCTDARNKLWLRK